MYQRIGNLAYKKDLTNISKLCDFIDNPQNAFNCIHVAGTNGKGSTSHILSAIYQANGYKVGLYTSPHLVDFRERIKINGEMCSENFVIEFTHLIEPVIESIQPSFFEITVAMAFYYFSIQNVDIAIIETGLGGRLDSTNIINPITSIITSIGFDHMDMLGNTLEKISFEKAGIIKQNTPIICGNIPAVAEKIIRSESKKKQATIFNYLKNSYPTDLLGNHQQWNIGSAMQCVTINQHLLPTSNHKTKEALLNVSNLTIFLGRWQIFSEHPLVIGDVAHNEEGFSIIADALIKTGREIHFILGFVKEKNLDKIIPSLPSAKSYSFVKPNVIRGMEPEETQNYFHKHSINGSTFTNLHEAIHTIFSVVSTNELIFVGGSNFIVADLLTLKNDNQLPF
jgi:dihydrofolate synthase / folylpolyglutamate synthase